MRPYWYLNLAFLERSLHIYYGKQKKFSRPNVCHEEEISSKYTSRFLHPKRTLNFTIPGVGAPFTNYLVRNAQLLAQPLTIQNNTVRP